MSSGDDSLDGPLSSSSGAQTAVFPTRKVVAGLLALYALALVAVFLPAWVPDIVTAPPVGLALTFVPGGLGVLLLYEDATLDTRSLLYAVGISLVSLLALGFTINLTLPLVGITRPIAPLPLAASVSVLVGGLALAVLSERQSGTLTVPVYELFSPPPLALFLLPLSSILAVSYLNRTGGNFPIVVVLAVLAVVPLIAVLRMEEHWHPLAVWTLALAVLYHKSFWKNFGFSGSPGVIRAWEAQRWSPGVSEVHPYSTELLQNGVLFPTFAWLSGVNIVTELEVINPFLVAFIPLAIFAVARHYVGSRAGVLAASMFAFAHPFYMQYPTAGRAATPVLFLSLFALVVVDDDLAPLGGSVLGLLFASGIIVSHYGTSYFVMFAFLGGLVVLQMLYAIDRTIEVRYQGYAADSGTTVFNHVLSRETIVWHRGVVSWTLALFYSVGAIAWYMYATQGHKFRTLPNHVVSSIQTLLAGGTLSGRTGARIQRDYGSLPIRLSKYLYLTLGLLMGAGLLYALYRRFGSDGDRVVDDRYLALASVMLGLFGFTFVARNWGGGRPMMIAFTFTTTFAVLGILAIGWVGEFVVTGRSSGSRETGERGRRTGLAVFAILLVVLFGLNSGLVSTLAMLDPGPSNVSYLGAQESHRNLDISTHVWINEHGTGNVWGDPVAHGQTDWYLPSIEIGTGSHRAYEDLNKPRGRLLSLRESGIEPGYVMLLSHNIKEQSIVRPYMIKDYPLSKFQTELESRNRIYTTGLSVIYYAPEVPGSGREAKKT